MARHIARSYPRWNGIPGYMVPFPIQAERSCFPLHATFTMETLHLLHPPQEIRRPLRWIRHIGCDDSKIVVLRRHDNMNRTPSISKSKKQATVSARIIGTIFHQSTSNGNHLNFFRRDHPLRPRHLSNGVRQV